MDTTTPIQAFNLYQALINLGLAGALLSVIIVPMLRWVMTEATASRVAFMAFLNDHTRQEVASLDELKRALVEIKSVVEICFETKHRSERGTDKEV